jgi:hypothetical protein
VKKIEIKHRWTSAVLFETEVEDGDEHPMRTALSRAILADAYLAGANLADANLADAYLADAYLAGANLADARNVPSSTQKVDPPTPYVRRTTMTDADEAKLLAERAAAYRAAHPEVPVVGQLDAKILNAVEKEGFALDMSAWHTYQTTHCRAGFAIHFAGEAGYALERKFDPQTAGAMIYRASTGRVPHFFATDKNALHDIRRSARIQTLAAETTEDSP